LRNIEGQGGNSIGIAVPNLLAFSSIVNGPIPDEFPNLKFGIIESGSEWASFAISRAQRYRTRYGVPDHSEKMLADGRMYITCEAHEDLNQIVKTVGENSLMLGTDYGHSDTSTELRAHAMLEDRPDLNSVVSRKMTRDNAMRFYGLN
jgi:predicted TIM-barrel fold metal-dependent hydrolase